MVMARMPSGFAVIGDTQHLPGYSLLLFEDSSVSAIRRPSAKRLSTPTTRRGTGRCGLRSSESCGG